MRILLIRHGPSAHPVPSGRLDRADVERWQADYDASGIAINEVPPPALIVRVAQANVVVASDLPRAAATASRLWPERPIVLSPLFREIPLRIPSLAGIRVPPQIWAAFIHLQWGLDILRGRDVTEDARRRAVEAAAWCQTTCRECGPTSVLAVVTHGVFRRVLARELTASGWKLSMWRRSYAPWSLWTVSWTEAPFTRRKTALGRVKQSITR